MQRKNKLIAMMLIVGIMPIVISCGKKTDSDQSTEETHTVADANETDLMADISRVSTFSWNLYNSMGKSNADSGKNLLISPVSAYIALTMAAEGAKGDTLIAFEDVLGVNAESLSITANTLIKHLTEVSGNTTLNIANSVWLDHLFSINEDFHEKMTNYFSADVFTENFQEAETVDMINTWVSNETEGLIEQFVNEIRQDEVIMLINTLYMDASWMTPFEAELTIEMDFNLQDGTIIKSEFLNSSAGNFTLIDTDEIEGVLLPYDDERLGFLALKPTERSTDIGDMVLDAAMINDLVSGAVDTENVVVSMPKFELEFKQSLVEILKTMGLSKAFDSEKADFRGLESTDGPSGLYISNVMQSTVIKVNELGTEAAAATNISIARKSAPIGDPTVFSLDSPYIYAIIDLDTNIPLFIGAMNNPGE